MQNISKTIHSTTTNGLSLTLNQSHNALNIALNNGYEQSIQSLKLTYKNFPTSKSPLIQFDKFNPQQVNIYPNKKLTNISLNGQNLQNFDFESFTSFSWIINDQIVRGIRGYYKEFGYFEIEKSLQFRSECLNYDNKKVVNILILLIDKENRLIIEDDNNIPIIFFDLITIELIKDCEKFDIKSINYNFNDKQITCNINIKDRQTTSSYILAFSNINILKLTKLKNNTSLLNIESIKLNFNKNNQLLYFNKFKLEIYLKLIKQLCKTKREGDSSDDDDEDSVKRDYKHSILISTLINFIILGQYSVKFKENLQTLIQSTNLRSWSMEFSQEYLQLQNIDKFLNYLREIELINNYLNSVEFSKIYNAVKSKLINLIQFLEGLKIKFSGCIEGFLKLSQEDYEGSEILLDNLEFFEWLSMDRDPYESWFSTELQPIDTPYTEMNLSSLDNYLKQCALNWINSNTKSIIDEFNFVKIEE